MYRVQLQNMPGIFAERIEVGIHNDVAVANDGDRIDAVFAVGQVGEHIGQHIGFHPLGFRRRGAPPMGRPVVGRPAPGGIGQNAKAENDTPQYDALLGGKRHRSPSGMSGGVPRFSNQIGEQGSRCRVN